jgi:gluconolactonase
MNKLFPTLLIIAFIACNEKKNTPTIGSIERIDPALDAIISKDALPEIIAEGMEWSEGPLWVENEKMLLFSDVPRNVIFKWTEKNGKEVYLEPSGYTDTAKRGGEMGSNGLLLDTNGKLVLCQHGNRMMARMDAPLNSPKPWYIAITSFHDEKRYNSPNDAVYNKKGELFFTDPPYGLENNMNDSTKEIRFQGVYKIGREDVESILICDSLTRPNGIAFLDEQTLLIGNSDPAKPNWYAIKLSGDSVISTSIFYSAKDRDPSWKGMPDGLKVDKNGNVFASGPGGIWIFNKEAKLLGRVRLTDPASNCALSADEKTLYITNDSRVLRLKMRN